MPEHKPLTKKWWEEILNVWFGGKATPEQVEHFLDTKGWWPQEFLEGVTHKAKLSAIRDGFQMIRDKDGNRIVHSTRLPGSNGKLEPYYMNEELFSVEEYRDVIYAYYATMGAHERDAERLRKQCLDRHKVRIDTYDEWKSQHTTELF
jgi:hypothetical protein